MIAYLLDKSEHSNWARRLLSFALRFAIPFNSPHRFRVHRLSSHQCEIQIPYIRKNLNHIKGIHACALATACEFASGLLLLRALGPSSYRIIMKELSMEYLFQGKMNSIATCHVEANYLDLHVLTPLRTNNSVELLLQSEVVDQGGNVLCRGRVVWQIKDWDKVRTKVN